MSGKNTQYIEISQNQPNLGHFRVLGFGDSKVQNILEVTKSAQKYSKYVTAIFFLKIYQKTTLFGKVAILLRKSSSPKKTISMSWFFFLKKIFWIKQESLITLKLFKVKVLSVFPFDTFLTMLNALWWIFKKARRGIFDFMFLVSSVLVMVSKNLLFCFRQGHLELFQCSAEGCATLKKISGIYCFFQDSKENIRFSLQVLEILRHFVLWSSNLKRVFESLSI